MTERKTPMHQAPPNRSTPPQLEDESARQERQEHPRPGLLSRSDPEPERPTGRVPIWLIVIIVLLVAGFVVLHLTGVAGPGMH
jgi:hypothetical protein